MRRSISLTIVAAALLCTPMPGWADSTANASLGPISLQLVDLAPGDGIDPSITFVDDAGYRYGYAHGYTVNWLTGESTYDYADTYGDDAWAPFAVSSLATGAAAQAALTGPGAADGSRVAASSHASGGGKAHDTTAGVVIYWGDSGGVNFRLSAYTRIVFAADGMVTAEVSSAWDPAAWDGGESALVAAWLRVSGAGSSQNNRDRLEATAQSIIVYDDAYEHGYYYTGNSMSRARLLDVSFVNATDSTLDGYLQFGASASAYSYAAPVPEAETYALMLAGLAVVGRLARRRQG